MGASRIFFNQLFKSYQGDEAVGAGAGPDGLSCGTRPCWLPQPIHAAAGAYVGATQKPLPLGRAEGSR